MKNTLVLGLLALVLIGGGCINSDQTTEHEDAPVIDRDAILYEAQQNGLIMTDDERALMEEKDAMVDSSARHPLSVDAYLSQDIIGWMSGALADVTGGSGYGIAHSQFANGEFTLIVEIGGLPEPADGYFYEGWLVKRDGDMSFVSTGEVVKTTTGYANVYHSSLDLTNYGFYVLTLEPDDGDPAPAEHILEGIIK